MMLNVFLNISSKNADKTLTSATPVQKKYLVTFMKSVNSGSYRTWPFLTLQLGVT